MIKLKRIYEKAERDDGFRVLIDRLWPRGVSKEKAEIDLWLKDIAPSDTLRKWFNHDPKKWKEFRRRYKNELRNKKNLIDQLEYLSKKYKKLTILYGAKDTEHNQAVALLDLLK